MHTITFDNSIRVPQADRAEHSPPAVVGGES